VGTGTNPKSELGLGSVKDTISELGSVHPSNSSYLQDLSAIDIDSDSSSSEEEEHKG